MNKKIPAVLCIIDGFGLNPKSEGNAIAQARKPNIDKLLSNCPNTTLITYGEDVGLPQGQMGNSEVGHLNIGAGRVVEQWLLRINRALKGDFLNSNTAYQTFLAKLSGGKDLHLVGLFSDGGVHSHIEHFYLLLDKLKVDFLAANPEAVIYLHLITDGRDTSPLAAASEIRKLQKKLEGIKNIKIATICGRFYAMDRDKRWERIDRAVKAMIESSGVKTENPAAHIESCYKAGITDEFLEPIIVTEKPITANDCLLFWNFREDRMRQLVSVLNKTVPAENILCFTSYDHSLKLPYIFELLEIKNHLGEWLSLKGLRQLRTAETEKYPHVTYFFNGGIEKEYPGEDRKMLPSPRDVKTYDQKPEMSADAVCDTVIAGIESGNYDLIVVNFANCDMVGHTGVIPAAIKAVETVDTCIGRIVESLVKHAGKALFIADHGNAEQMIDYQSGLPHTAHTKFPVPAILFGCGDVQIVNSRATLKDVAPTVLKMLGLPLPLEMSGIPLY
jgi:2,3-bisphosphoglycerate-independent phosphoglycerate mutase